MKWLNWEKGRQNSGYEKMLLATLPKPFPFDCYLLKYPEGSKIGWHTDEVPEGKNHYRLNITLQQPLRGGLFRTKNPPIYKSNRVAFFRPDKNEHEVTEIEEGTRYVFSFGFLKRSNKGDL